MREGTAADASAQYEELLDAQRKVRKKKSDQIIDNTDKSRQLERHRWSRIKAPEDAEEQYGDEEE